MTGGAQGIGFEFARRLIDNGARVCIADIKENVGKEAARKLCKEFAVGKETYILSQSQTAFSCAYKLMFFQGLLS